jgi:hypothetical protein
MAVIPLRQFAHAAPGFVIPLGHAGSELHAEVHGEPASQPQFWVKYMLRSWLPCGSSMATQFMHPVQSLQELQSQAAMGLAQLPVILPEQSQPRNWVPQPHRHIATQPASGAPPPYPPQSSHGRSDVTHTEPVLAPAFVPWLVDAPLPAVLPPVPSLLVLLQA